MAERLLIGLRRFTQVGVLGLLVATPVLTLWGVRRTTVYEGEELGFRYSVLGGWITSVVQGTFGDPPAWAADGVVGGTWSMRLGGLELADPIAAASVVAGGHLPPVSLLWGAVLVLAFQALLGRVFCGWLCPYGALSRLVSRVRPWLLRRGLVHRLQPPNWLRYPVLAAVVLAPVLGLSVVSWTTPYLAVPTALHGLVFGGAAGGLGLVAAALLADLLLFDHGVCRALCPSGALQAIVGRARLLRVSTVPGVRCEGGCHACTEVCWLGLDPRGGRLGPDCDGCGRCVDVCPSIRLQRRVVLPRWAAALLMLTACAQPAAVERITPEASWSSPFSTNRGVAFAEWRLEGGTVGVGVSSEPGSEAIRLLVVQPDGDPYTGPLTVRLGRTEVAFDAPTAPRSVMEPVFYETQLSGLWSDRLHFVDGPVAGAQVLLPSQTEAVWPAAVPALGVVGMWWMGFLIRSRRRGG